MGPKRKEHSTPTQRKAKSVLKKYGKRMTPDKKQRLRKALFSSSKMGIFNDEATTSSISSDKTTPASKLLLRNSVVKGYHVFQIRPPQTFPPTQLTIDREYTNTHDDKACLVWIPPLESFPKDLHNQFTDEKRQLMLSDVAGLPVGHVPKCISDFFCSVMDNGGTIFAEVTGDPVSGFSPWPAKDQEGGGIVLPCDYVFTDIDIDVFFCKLQTLLSDIVEGKCMKVEKEQ